MGPTDLLESNRFNVDVHTYEFLSAYKTKMNPNGALEMPPFYKE